MYFPKFTGLLSSLGVPLLMAAAGVTVHQSGAIATNTEPGSPTHLDTQRESLAENPLCQLATDLASPPVARLVRNPAPAANLPTVNWATTLFQRFTENLGLDFLVALEEPLPVVPRVTVLPRPGTAPSPGAAQLVSYDPDQGSNQTYQLWIQGQPIASLRSQEEADRLAQKLEQLIQMEGFDGAAIAPTLHEGKPAIAQGEQILLVIDEKITQEEIINHEILAMRWANNLRLALGVPALDMVTAQTKMYQLQESNQSLEGLASWYGPYFHGRLTANGETYDQYALTAAHPDLPLNTFLKVTNLNNQRSVIIRLNDRGPYIPPRSLDLSLGAAQCLNSVETGVIPYKATLMTPKEETPKAIAPDMI